MELKNISKIYKISNTQVIALDNVSYDFGEEKFYLIKGHSGSGKTTLIQIMGLMLDSTFGDVIINNKNVKNMSNTGKSKLKNRMIGFIFQNYCLNEKLTAIDNVILPMLINDDIDRKERFTRAKDLLSKMGLEKRYNHYPEELSGGEQQRVAIARALANDPKIILADEPTGNLDKKSEIYVLNLLKDIVKQGKTVIMVSHSDIACKYADIILEIEDGKLREVSK